METALKQHGLEIAGKGAHGGSSFWMQAPDGCDTAELARNLQSQSVLIEPGAPFFASTDPPRQFYRLGYSSIPTTRIPEGVAHIARALAPGAKPG
jgi:GntR family transcriptional regulator/MocR family aminotransferase